MVAEPALSPHEASGVPTGAVLTSSPPRLGAARPSGRRRPRTAHQSRALIALLLTIGLVVLFLPSVALAGPLKPPAGSCIGTDPCTGNTGSLQTNACVGDFACFFNTGSINK